MIKEEFRKITTVSLEQSFMYNLDHYTPKLTALMKAKGVVLGTKLMPFVDMLSQRQNIEMRHGAVIHSLILYLDDGADGDDPVDDSILLEGKELKSLS